MKHLVAIAALIPLLAGCGDSPDQKPAKTEMKISTQLSGDGNRVTVTRLSKFDDDLSYSGRRAVYLIHDLKTGKEFIGVSGIGITEVGRHDCGKGCSVEDER